jgi:hypothetical protein
MPGTSSEKLFRSKRVLLEDGLQEAGILVGYDGKIGRIVRKEALATSQHNAEVGMHQPVRSAPGRTLTKRGMGGWQPHSTTRRWACIGLCAQRQGEP